MSNLIFTYMIQKSYIMQSVRCQGVYVIYMCTYRLHCVCVCSAHNQRQLLVGIGFYFYKPQAAQETREMKESRAKKKTVRPLQVGKKTFV